MNGIDQKNYDSEFCGSLPLHLVNLIQPYGVLLVLERKQLTIVQLSENATDIFSSAPSSLIGTSFAKIAGEKAAEEISSYAASGFDDKRVMNFHFGNEAVSFQTMVHFSEELILLEIDRQPRKPQSLFLDIFHNLKKVIASIEAATSIDEVCHSALGELKKISGFDRIMLYRFDEQWNGSVIGEVLEPGMDPYLGLRFPASDIPRQARQLYLTNPYRLIPTRDYKPVRLYPVINPVTGAFIDLSACNLRSVPAVHLEYLKNMGVTASMSTRILRENKLWGLISCHHRTEKYLDFETCALFELMSNIISARIGAIENRDEYNFNSRLKLLESQLIRQLHESGDVFDGLFKRDVSLLQLLSASGAAVTDSKRIRTSGVTPSEDQVKEMIYWLQNKRLGSVYHVTNLAGEFEAAGEYSAIASGIIVLPIDEMKGQYVIGFRPEMIQEVNWGGNPNEAINFEKDQVTYHPRSSFRLWQQIVKNTSAPWLPGEVMAAEDVTKFIWNTR